jgi:hypothetical protein
MDTFTRLKRLYEDDYKTVVVPCSADWLSFTGSFFTAQS